MTSDANSQNFHAPKSFPYDEATLAVASGIVREHLQEGRSRLLVEGVDFVREKRRVVLSYAGATTLLAALGVPLDDAERLLGVQMPPEQKNDAQAPTRAIAVFKVYRRSVVNAHVLLVTDGVSVFRLRVRSKENFRPGMDVRCNLISGDLYDLAGNAPRYPGKY